LWDNGGFGEWLKTTKRIYYSQLIETDGEQLVPEEAGLYIWGADRTVEGKAALVPRYVGMAAPKLGLRKRIFNSDGEWHRVAGRYVIAPKFKREGKKEDLPTQTTLAYEYYDEIIRAVGNICNDEYADKLKPLTGTSSPVVKGCSAFPDWLVNKFISEVQKGQGPKQPLRMRHAVDWALHGGANLEHLWIVFPPTQENMDKPQMEQLEKKVIDDADQYNKQHKLPHNKQHKLPPLLNRESH